MDQITTKFINTHELPLVIEPKTKNITPSEFAELLVSENEFFKKNLLRYGGLLFRNFPINDEHDFSSLIKNLNTGKFIDYIGGDSPRHKITEGIYTSTEAPPSFKIPLHNELSFVNKYPSHIYFYCHIPPVEHGQTIIANARKVYQSIDEEVKKKFIERKLKYVSSYHNGHSLIYAINKSHRSWMDVLETNDKQEAEKICRENDFSFKWQNNWLQISTIRPAAISHPQTKETVWFNQAHHFDFNPRFLGFWNYLGTRLLYLFEHTRFHQVFFADGEPIPRKDLYHIFDTLDANTIYFPCQKGDVLVLDNILTMHGRAPFSGKRRVLAAMTG